MQRTCHEIDAVFSLRPEKSGTGVHSTSLGEPQNGHDLSVALSFSTSASVGSMITAMFRTVRPFPCASILNYTHLWRDPGFSVVPGPLACRNSLLSSAYDPTRLDEMTAAIFLWVVEKLKLAEPIVLLRAPEARTCRMTGLAWAPVTVRFTSALSGHRRVQIPPPAWAGCRKGLFVMGTPLWRFFRFHADTGSQGSPRTDAREGTRLVTVRRSCRIFAR